MFDAFWKSLDIDSVDITKFEYTDTIPYSTIEQKEEVVEKLDWMIMKLYKVREERKEEYEVISEMKEQILYNECSLTIKGIEFLNWVGKTLHAEFS